MALLNFGGFQLDVDARRIYSTDGELAVEPKVIEVLCYLIQHRDRLVPLAELQAESLRQGGRAAGGDDPFDLGRWRDPDSD